MDRGRRQQNLLQYLQILQPLLFKKKNTAISVMFRQTCPKDFFESYLLLTITISRNAINSTSQGFRSEIPPAQTHSSKYRELSYINIFGFPLDKATCLGTTTQFTSALQPTPNPGSTKGRNPLNLSGFG